MEVSVYSAIVCKFVYTGSEKTIKFLMHKIQPFPKLINQIMSIS